MPISQDRLRAIVSAAAYYRDEYRNLKSAIQDLGLQPDGLGTLIRQTYEVKEDAGAAETIIKEEVHLKLVGAKNDRHRLRQQHNRRAALGLEPEAFPKRNYPKTIQQPKDRRLPTHFAPSIPNQLPAKVEHQFTEEQLREIEMAKISTQRQSADLGAVRIIMTDTTAGQIPTMGFKRGDK